MRKLSVTILAVVLTLALLLLGVGCGAPAEKEVTVGNKNFTEQYIIGEMMKQLLEDNGFTVNLESDLSSMVLRGGMAAGDIDICADYTGTAWMVHLGHTYEAGVDNNELYELVQEEDEVIGGFVWLDPMWNNNTYALASWAEFADDNAVATLSDLAALYQAEEGKITTFIDFEWSTRPDGLPAMEEFYGFEIAAASILTGAPGASVLGLENHDCEVAMVFGTDAKIAEHGWHVYLDDLSFFPPYDLTPYVSAQVLDEYPEIGDILNELAATFPGGGESATPEIVGECQSVWQELNAKVDIDMMEPEEVAYEYLVENGLIEG
ncbi:MAG TPA: glycine/betaine ABC transporter substrate-binding protein [Dehalococcoidia bacterium]|nr:glycine/betaine ABC transporter substrate-binding protein [Dehalococcoidia bacterium]